MQNVVFADLGHAVVLLLGAVVSQALAVVSASGAVVPQVPTVVPLPWSGSTVASGQALLHAVVGADVIFYIRPHAVVPLPVSDSTVPTFSCSWLQRL